MNKQKTNTKTEAVKAKPKLDAVVKAAAIVQKPVIQKTIASKPAASKPVVTLSAKSLPVISTTPAPKPAVADKRVSKKELIKVNPESEPYFVYLKNPLEYRRQLLECSRKALFCLKIHQEVILIRQKKLEEMHNLKSSVRELLFLNKKFNEKLPKYHLEALGSIPTRDKVAPTHSKSNNSKKHVEIKAEKTEMERLEESLANIERKLKTLQ